MATGKRLIDANSLFPGKIFAVNIKNPMESVEDLMNRINNAPTVDAVEVVRCKDCKFFHDKGYCVLVTGLNRIKPEDDFCSHGERKDNV